ncbi:MAG: LysM peptidoglycan-binding domain-containing protein [Thiothrix sp.]|nr:LysM peptidoglycan-binding domain-containing protein [Thiothrix sp.]
MKLNKVALATLLSCGLLASAGTALAHGNGSAGGASVSIGVIGTTGYVDNGDRRGNVDHRRYNRNDRNYRHNTRGNHYRRAPVQVRYVYVQRGDTLGRIAARHRVNPAHLQRLNNLYGHRANQLWIGMRLRIN